MRDYEKETAMRVEFIQGLLEDSGAGGIVFGNSGGKDSVLTGILCKLACKDTIGLIMPCGSKRNYAEDMRDAIEVAEQYGIEYRAVDLGAAYDAMKDAVGMASIFTQASAANIAPRLRMAALYAVAANEGRLVAGTGNRSEKYMGYFTKWGDGAYDFNPIADLTVKEIYEFLEYHGAPRHIIEKPPSAGLADGQTDEGEMGVSYKSIDELLLTGQCSAGDLEIISEYHRKTGHKRSAPPDFGAV